MSTPSVLTPNLFARPVNFLIPVVFSDTWAVFSRAAAVLSVTRSTALSAIFTPSMATAIGFSRLIESATPSNNASYCFTIPFCRSKNIDTTIDFLIGEEYVFFTCNGAHATNANHTTVIIANMRLVHVMTDCFFLTVLAPPISITSISFFLRGIRKTPLHYAKEFRRLLLPFAIIYLVLLCNCAIIL